MNSACILDILWPLIIHDIYAISKATHKHLP